MILYKYVNCAVDKTIASVPTTSTDCDSSYTVILIMMLFVTPCSNPLKADPFSEICIYAAWVKPSSFAKYTPWQMYMCLLLLKIFNTNWRVIRELKGLFL